MILDMYAIKDELNGFTTPIPFMKEEMAKRYLKDQVKSNPTVGNTKEDFSIWNLGTFDTETGNMDPLNQPRLVERATAYGD